MVQTGIEKKSLWYLVLKIERQIAIQAVGWVVCPSIYS